MRFLSGFLWRSLTPRQQNYGGKECSVDFHVGGISIIIFQSVDFIIILVLFRPDNGYG